MKAKTTETTKTTKTTPAKPAPKATEAWPGYVPFTSAWDMAPELKKYF